MILSQMSFLKGVSSLKQWMAVEMGLFAELSGAQKAWALDRATAHPLGLSDQQNDELDAFWEMNWNASVVYCRSSPNPPQAHQRATAERLNARWLELDAGHYPMLTHPNETAAMLLA